MKPMRGIWRRALVLLTVTMLPAAWTAGDGAALSADEALVAGRVRAHMEFLADDLLEGRAAGTRGYDLAANYVAAVLKTYGFEAGGEGGSFFQPVPLRESRLTDADVSLEPDGGAPVRLTLPDDAVVAADHLRGASEVSAPLVYAAFGVTAPELDYDDYAGLDVAGKIVVLLRNAPARFPSEPRAHYASTEQKLRNAAARGAVGVMLMALPSDEQRLPWAQVVRYAGEPQMAWLDAEGEPANQQPSLQAVALLGPTGAAALFAHAPEALDDVYAAGEQDEARGFALPVRATIRRTTEHRRTESANVLGLLRGRDADLAESYVVLTAHLDHTGIGPAVDGDTIYNGAFDNAAGCAILLEVARAFAEAPERPRRSLLVVFVTAEEKGLLGSDYFARHPPVPAERLVANVNLDMPLLQWPLADVIAFGAENSSLHAVVERAAAEAGLALAPDPMPQENLFVRSDQYSLVKQGVPAVFLVPGFTSADPAQDAAAMLQRFLTTHYHQPSDDLTLPIDEGAVAVFTRVNHLIARAIANDPAAPAWKPGNFFGETFGRR